MLHPNVLSEIEIKRLLESTDTNTSAGLRDRAILELLYATGLRIGVLVLLDITSLNLIDKYVLVRAKTSMSKSDRIISFGGVAQCWVNRYINEVRADLYRMRVASGSSANFLFLGKGDGGMLNTRTCHLIVSRQAKRAGITKRVCPHTLRRSFATHLFNGGANLIVIQKLLGHVNVETTQIYTHTATLRLKKIHSKHHPRGGNFALEKGRHY
jgi:integrase/recombinase XerD